MSSIVSSPEVGELGVMEMMEPGELEARATRVLEAVPEFVWDGETLPVPIEDIVDSVYGLLVRDVEDMTSAPVPGGIGGDWISGLLLPTLGEIWVNAEDARRWPPRRRFTICHELGHWELHRTGQQTLFCRAGFVDPGGVEDVAPTARDRPPVEEEADTFAAALLMPAHLLSLQRDAVGGDVPELCRRFGCSEKAMRRRLASV